MMLDALLAAATPPAPATGIQFPTIDPIAVSIGPFAIRWYALAYIAGLMLGWRYIVRLTRTPRLWAGDKPGVTSEQGDDFLFWATLGVILGGRIGYVLFYQPGHYLTQPLDMLAVWRGGMSFHGGLLGVLAATFLFARRQGLAFFELTDALAVATPIGLCLGRIANFINAELWGRVTDLPWAMVFPTGGPEPRHPSQLYEAALEGLVLFAVMLWFARRPYRQPERGLLSGIFLVGYALARITAEFFRQPDLQIGYLAGGITMGQLLSLPMLAFGVFLVLRARRRVEAMG
jgi:phosphatidylglycerol:prolipoprotein diacylglycerol transferase